YLATGGRARWGSFEDFLNDQSPFWYMKDWKPGGGGGGGSSTTIGDIMRSVGITLGSLESFMQMSFVLNLRQQLIDAKLNPGAKAKFIDYMTLIDKVPELFNLYSQARSVFIPKSGTEGEELYYLGQQDPPFSNKININTDKMGDLLKYAFTIGHEMLHVFDDKYNYSKFMSLFSKDDPDFKRDRYTIPVYMLFKEYRSYNWEKGLGNEVNIEGKLEQYRVMWSLPTKTLNYLNHNIKTFSNIFINP
ncbi:hypothetical protein, partial [Chryseobacterium taichungense]|uniref:hypothetical protein n=1 Tax=Chryseobacterium taichungense TaxID=295069 RepID=UPI0028A6B0E5